MGYRELLKRYMSYLERTQGSNFLGRLRGQPDPSLSEHDVGELTRLAAELDREKPPARTRAGNVIRRRR